MIAIKDVPAATIVKFPEHSYERGSIMVKTTIVNKFSFSDGSIGESCLFIAMNDTDICDKGDLYWLSGLERFTDLQYLEIKEV